MGRSNYNDEEEVPLGINRIWVYKQDEEHVDSGQGLDEDQVSEYDDEPETTSSSSSKSYSDEELKRLARRNRVYRPSRFRKWKLGLLGLAGFIGLSIGTTTLVMHLKQSATTSTTKLNEKPTLNFRKVGKSYKFKVVQLADLHFGEDAGTEEGRRKDEATWRVVDSILKAEQPDLIVLSGDQISAETIEDNANGYYYMIGEHLSQYGIPWALTFGAHDDADYHKSGSDTTTKAKYSREDLLAVDMSFPLSMTQRGPHEIFGMTNYMLEMNIDGFGPAANIYMFDSGGGQLPSMLKQNQVEWFYNSPQRLPAIAFQHHPTGQLRYDPQKCKGFHEESVELLEYDPGITEAMSESGRVHFLAVGQAHGNDYCCHFSPWMQVCFGAHSGYGGYGDWERGARVYELSIEDPSTYEMDWDSWVRLESGDVQDIVTQEMMLRMPDGI